VSTAVTRTASILWRLFALLLVVAAPAAAQDAPTVRAFLDRNAVAVNQPFTLSVEVQGVRGLDGEPEFPELDGFARYLGSNQSTSMQVVNGQANVSVTVQYRWIATVEGTHQIPALDIRAGGQTLTTEPLTLTVGPGAAGTRPSPAVGQTPDAEGPVVAEDDLFIVAEVDDRSVYENQPVFVSYRIFTRVNVNSYQVTSSPSTEGFWAEELPAPRQGFPVEQVTRDGVRYATQVVRRVALFPTGAGERSIEPLTIEARVRVERRSGDPFSDFFGGSGVPIATTSDFMGTATYDDFSPRISLSYSPSDEHNLYATYSQGFKGGGFDPRGQSTAAPDANGDGTVSEDEVFDFMNFDSEDVNSFEIGAKSSWLGGRATTSVAAFYTDYTDYQVPASAGVDTDGDGINDTFSGNVENAGELTIQGLEIEASALLGEDIFAAGDLFNVNVAAGFLDAEFEEFFLAGVDVADSAGLQNTPETTLSGVFNYQVPFAGGQISSSLTASYRGDTQQFEFAEPLVDQEAFTLIDLSVVWTSDSGRWDIGLYGKNLTDEEYKVAAYDFVDINSATGAIIPTLGLEGPLTAFYGDPQTVAIGIGYRY